MEVEGVVIAAGKSLRMSPNHKLLLDLDGRTVIWRCIESLYEFCSRIIVVTGHNPQLITQSIGYIEKVEFVHNEGHEDGMFSSIKTGLLAARGDRIFCMPADCPFVGREVFLKLLSVWDDIVIPSFCGVQGHPVLLSMEEAKRIREDLTFVSLDEYIGGNRFSVVQVDDPGVLWDIDTPENYVAALRYLRKIGG
ncbi:nucleotidyltransferase family protein [Gudongella sp. SC589]|uniref:nucleotidyltransferase family protein n=1 Tax=Gudongella sp. SC589 TaxID=3385990 RepID=UPI0039047E17